MQRVVVVLLVGAAVTALVLVPAPQTNAQSTPPEALAQVRVALLEVARGQDSHRARHDAFTDNFVKLRDLGVQVPRETVVSVTTANGGFCAEAIHINLPGRTFSYNSRTGEVVSAPCV